MASNSPFQASGLSIDSAASARARGNTKPESTPQNEQGTQRLPAVLGMRDLTVLFVLIVLYPPSINTAQFAGPAAFIYWPLAALAFLLPCMYVTQWLARRFPGQGAPYFWAVRILGPKWSFIAAFCAWWPGVLVPIIAIQNAIIFIQYLAPTWFTTPYEQCQVILVGLAVATAISCLPLRWLKHILFGMVLLYLFLYVMLGMAGSWWLWSGHPVAVSLNSLGSWQPNGGNFAVFGLIALGFVGVDVPLFLGGEIRGGKVGAKRARYYVWWGGAITFLAYMMGTFGIMVIVPPGQAGALGASMQAISMAFGSTAGSGAAILFTLIQVAVTVVFLLTYSRLLVVMAKDNRLPKSLTRVNRYGVPVLSIVVQVAVVTSVTILSFVAAPALLDNFVHPTDIPFEIYNVLAATASVLWELSIAILFFCAIGIFYHQKRRIRILTKQKTFLLSMSILGAGISFFGIWATMSSSWDPTLIPNNDWVVIVGGVSLLSVAIGWISSEVPRARALLREQHRVNEREVVLRAQLQEAYNQQQELLAEMDRLYREQTQTAVTDAVTGLPNHRAAMSRIEEEVSRCQRTQSSCAMLFVDLDHFKHVNDTCGHQAGDAILHEVGNRLRTTLRMEDFVGRYGGEEFVVVLTDADVAEASQTAERLRIAVAAQPCSWQAEETQTVVPIAVTASIGVAVYHLHGVTREVLIEAADRAMYAAKHSGRNRVCLADVETGLASAQDMLKIANSEEIKERAAVQALIAAASAHDRGTSAHAQRMTWLAEATARVLERPEEELHLIRLGALLHDIGKIGIPHAILHKPGPLTDEEWDIMRHHPDIGRQILEQTGGIFHFLSHVVVAHHERWDGRGYPNRLAKEAIPMSARILAVVDSYDAMTSHRPYRKPLSDAEARTELQRCAGLQFDPLVVEAFLHVLEEADAQFIAPRQEPHADAHVDQEAMRT